MPVSQYRDFTALRQFLPRELTDGFEPAITRFTSLHFNQYKRFIDQLRKQV